MGSATKLVVNLVMASWLIWFKINREIFVLRLMLVLNLLFHLRWAKTQMLLIDSNAGGDFYCKKQGLQPSTFQ